MEDKPIIILGFGRSGTTWLSDIISKSLGGLILFEPFHPLVCQNSKELCYENGSNQKNLEKIKKHINFVMTGNSREKWLLRNHLTSKIEDTSVQFLNQIWENCTNIGIKSIRLNFMIPWLFENISDRIVYIKREPKATISSILNRHNFFNEYGFEFHEIKMLQQIKTASVFTESTKNDLLDFYQALNNKIAKISFFWAITDKIVTNDLNSIGIDQISYEELYENPYKITQRILSNLGVENQKLHPSYIFTPSMLTLKTSHELEMFENSYNKLGSKVFWKESISELQANTIDEVVARIKNI